MNRSIPVLVSITLLVSACVGTESSTTVETEPSAQPTSSTAQVTSTVEPEPTEDAPELGGTSWNVINYRQGNAITNVWKTEVTIAFATDGVLSGSGGCNGYGGLWTVSGGYDPFESGVPDPADGQALSLEGPGITQIGCSEDINQQETEIMDLLVRTGRWVLIRGNLNLRDEDGAFLLEAESV